MRHSPRLLTWLFVLSGLAAIVAMALSASPAGRRALDRVAGREEAMALLPGVTVETAPPPAQGLVVTSLRSDSEAAALGVAVGDTVAAIDGRPVETLDRARAYLHNDRAGRIALRLMHGGDARSVTLRRQGGAVHGA